INPVFVTRAAMNTRGEEILTGYADSANLGTGQFCTKPGVVFVPEEAALDALVNDFTERSAGTLLNDRVAQGFADTLDELTEHPATETLVQGKRTEDRKSTRLNSSHVSISYAVFCLKKKNTATQMQKKDSNKTTKI